MSNKIHTNLIIVTSVLFLFTGMAFAKTKKIDVIYASTVGKTLKLNPGNYRISVANNMKAPMVNFFNSNGKMVGTVPVKVDNLARKNSDTQVDYNTVASNGHDITSIRPKGWKEKLVFSQPKAE
jgi:hypothetical protein